MFPPAEWTQEMCLKQPALTGPGPELGGAGGKGAGLALTAQGQGQCEVSLPSGFGHPAATQTRGGHRSASMEMSPSFLTSRRGVWARG